MKTETPLTIYLKDYQPPDFVITHSNLEITLGFETTVVHARHTVVRKNADARNLQLHCERMDVQSVAVNGNKLECGQGRRQFSQTDSQLILHEITHEITDDEAQCFTLDIVNTIDPSQNTALSGLYKSADMLCTQCEAEGYRRITPGIDRPDNLAIYTVKLIADKARFPVLLCNGNLVESGLIENDELLHYTCWHDPFPKPTYLFAIVAGKLSCLEDHFETMHGRVVSLKFYAHARDIEKCAHAMTSLQYAMRWDEQVYGREYDLDLFNVVAVDDFNMGAMENKSLNIFNTKYVLADSKMATDDDFQYVESVIGHEYFHNWSGNRVTCRDWFQLSLKEGFTVFRDQEFSADRGSRGVKRIEDVNALRAHQFNEDSSPMAHAVRPDAYQEINNLYTATVYDKGAEVIRMMQTLLGVALFHQGTDFYFEKYDGQAVTTDDFVAAMETVSKQDLTQFKHWYSQSGTPQVEIDTDFDSENACYQIKMRQSCPPTPGQKKKQPFVIPIKTALFSSLGEKLLLKDISINQVFFVSARKSRTENRNVYGIHEDSSTGLTPQSRKKTVNRGALNDEVDELTLILDQPEQTFNIRISSEIHSPPIPSLLREFSAPIEMKITLSDKQLETLLIHDDDPFNRWEAAQKLFLKQILGDIVSIQSGGQGSENARLCQTFRANLKNNSTDHATLSKLLTLPATAYINEQVSPIDPKAIELARRQLKTYLATAAKDELLDCYHQCQSINTGKPDAEEMAARTLRDTCLDYLNTLDDDDAQSLCLTQLHNARCMTDSASAMYFISRSLRDDKQQLLDSFAEQWKAEPLVLDKWFRAQSTFAHDSTLSNVENLTRHAEFDFTNPNKVYALILGFTHGNPFCFHADDGSGYQFITHWIKKLDPLNPQVSARLVSALNSWREYKPAIKTKMEKTLIEISSLANLSNDVGEIVGKNLATIKD